MPSGRGSPKPPARLKPALRIDFATYPRLGKGDAALFKQTLGDGADGMIICPGAPATVKPLIHKAARGNIPVICVATDAPGTERLAAVTACPFTSGAVVAELLCRTVRSAGTFALITGSLKTEDHAEKVEGFRSTMKALDQNREIAAIVETQDDARIASPAPAPFFATAATSAGCMWARRIRCPYCRPLRRPGGENGFR